MKNEYNRVFYVIIYICNSNCMYYSNEMNKTNNSKEDEEENNKK